ncbi:hypothetical protein ACQSSU_20435 [Micromonospora echinospora]
MTWTAAVAGTTPASAVSPRTITAAGIPGRLYVLIAARSSATDPIAGVTDSGGNTWTVAALAPTSGSTGRRIELWWCTPTAGFSTVDVALTGPAVAYTALVEITGHDGTPPTAAADIRTTAAGTNPEPVTVTPPATGMLVIAAVQANPLNASQVTPSAGWTPLPADPAGPVIVYRVDAPAGTPTGVSWTLTTATGSGHVIAAFPASDDPPRGYAVTVWDGTAEHPATVEGVWTGTSIAMATVDAVS